MAPPEADAHEAVDMTLFDQHWTSRLQNRPYTHKKETGAWVGGAFLGLLALPFGPIGMVVLGAFGAAVGALVGLIADKREQKTGKLLASREHRRLKYLIRYASDRFPRSDDPAGFLESVITEFKPVAEIGMISNAAKKELVNRSEADSALRIEHSARSYTALLYCFLCRDDVHQCLWIYMDDFLKNWRTFSSADFVRICVDILKTLVSMDEALSSKPQFEVVKRMKAFIEHPNIKPIYEHSQWHPPSATQRVIESLMYTDALERQEQDTDQTGIREAVQKVLPSRLVFPFKIAGQLRKVALNINQPWKKQPDHVLGEIEEGDIDTPYVSPASSSRGNSMFRPEENIDEADLFVISRDRITEGDAPQKCKESNVAVGVLLRVCPIACPTVNREVFFKDFDDFLNFDLELKHKLPIGTGEFRFLEEKEKEPYEGWDVCVNKPKVKVVKLKSDASPSVLVRAWATVSDTSAELVLYHIHDFGRRVEWDKTFNEMRLLKPTKDDEFCDTLYCVLRAPLGVQTRDFLQYRRVSGAPSPANGAKRFLILMRSAARAEMPEVPQYIRAETVISGYIIEQAGDSRDTSLFILSQTDIKGLIPKWIVNTAAGRVPVQWVESLEDACRKYRAEHPDHQLLLQDYISRQIASTMKPPDEAVKMTATSL
ncbi:hypothetical protein FOL47_001127 [Perkinsus chesapeaki]|uniref:START domain-containing protein n=1 Tax=Perkinsus chesapeaki TaxID=330153 RepID=A0A7J6MKD3_PERCH|nr:hypothetical protein FOL47_001127 [Perkinsus chesapeaki]